MTTNEIVKALVIPDDLPLTEIRFCHNSHPLWVEGARTKSGKCRLCWNVYNSKWRKDKRKNGGEAKPQPAVPMREYHQPSKGDSPAKGCLATLPTQIRKNH